MKTKKLPVFSHPAFHGLLGVSRKDITPPIGIYIRNWGAAQHDTVEGIHRPLTLTALTIQERAADSAFVLIAMDLGWWRTGKDEWFVRGGLIEALSLDPARVMISLSHTHSGPGICRDDAHKPGGHLIAPYLEKIRNAVIEATRQALNSRAKATLAWSHGKCALAVNRDLSDPEKPRKVCGYNPFETADDTLLVGRITEVSGKILATLVNYACHPTTLAWGNRMASPDYVGAMREVVESQTGGVPCMFLYGAAGELSPREQYIGDHSIADAHGRQLGFSALAVLEGMLPHQTQLEYAGVVESGAALATWSRAPQPPCTNLAGMQTEIEIPLKNLPKLAEIEEEMRNCKDRVIHERLDRKRLIRLIVGDLKTTQRPLWAWRIGDALVVGQSEEPYSRLQTELRRRFPNHPVVVMSLVNGGCGYLPPAEMYDQPLYQVSQTPFERGCLEKTIQASEEAIHQLLNG